MLETHYYELLIDSVRVLYSKTQAESDDRHQRRREGHNVHQLETISKAGSKLEVLKSGL